MKNRKKWYQLGGLIPGEVEGGEVLETPEGDTFEFEGPGHEQGGIQVPLPEGAIIFSKTLKGPDGKTMAQRKKVRDSRIKKVAKGFDKNPFDQITRMTLNKVLGDGLNEEMQDLAVQEMANMVEQYGTFNYGGMAKKYQYGGQVDNRLANFYLRLREKNILPTEMTQDEFVHLPLDQIEGYRDTYMQAIGALTPEQQQAKFPKAKTVSVTNYNIGLQEETPGDTLTFEDAFKIARKQGLDVFKFDNKMYSTELGANVKPSGRKTTVPGSKKEEVIPMSQLKTRGYGKGGRVSKEKAKEILRHGSVRGHKLTKKQRGLFGAIAGGANLRKYQGGTGPYGLLPETLRKLDPSKLFGAFSEYMTPEQLQKAQSMMVNRVTPTLPTLQTIPQEGMRTINQPLQPLPTLLEQRANAPRPVSYKAKSPIAGAVKGAIVGGTALGPLGAAVGAAGPLLSTIINRLGDKRIPNYMEQFGQEALETNRLSMQGAAGAREAAIRDIGLLRPRGTGRGVNTQAALNQATAAQLQRSAAGATNQYFSNLSGLLGRRGDIQLQRDQARMQGAEQAATANEMARDQFFTNLSQNFSTIGEALMHIERNKEGKPNILDLLGLNLK